MGALHTTMATTVTALSFDNGDTRFSIPASTPAWPTPDVLLQHFHDIINTQDLASRKQRIEALAHLLGLGDSFCEHVSLATALPDPPLEVTLNNGSIVVFSEEAKRKRSTSPYKLCTHE